LNDFFVVARTDKDPRASSKSLREAARSIDPVVPLSRFQTMEDAIYQSHWQPRFYLWTFSIFLAVAVVLAALGIYSVMAYVIAQRYREYGIRMILGARSGQVVGLVVRQGVMLVCVGIGVGLGISLVLSRFLDTMLFAVEPTDLFVYGMSSAIMWLGASLAVYLPARRISKTDLQAIVRHE
jgi:putative ABC transport system permease protein